MRDRIAVFGVVLGVVLVIHLRGVSSAQSIDIGAQRQEVAGVKEIVQRVRAGTELTWEDFDILDSILMRIDRTLNAEPVAQDKGGGLVTPAFPDKRGSKPPSPGASSTSTSSTKDGTGPISMDIEAQKKEVARVKEFVQRMRAGMRLTPEEVGILENVLMRIYPISGTEATKAQSNTPKSPEKRDSKPLPQVATGLSMYPTQDGSVYVYVIDLNASDLRTFWLDQRHQPYESIAKLDEDQLRAGYKLKFAINGGIFDSQYRPKGLFIEQGEVLSQLDTSQPGSDQGNFYLEPNGVFIIDCQGNARILTTQRFRKQFPGRATESIRLAVQSGPALVVDGEINPQFTEDSVNKKMRSGVGVLDGRRVVFVMSAGDISFREFAAVFTKLGCRDALFLDGGAVGALYIEDKLRIRVNSSLVTMLGVIEKLQNR